MPYTPDIPIYYADAATEFDPVAISQARATSVEAQLGLRANYTYRWENQGERDRQIGVRDGDRGFQVDTGTLYVRTNGVWTPQQFASDTGWITDAITLRSGYSPAGGDPMNNAMRIRDGITSVKLHITGTFSSGSGGSQFADFTPEFNPPRQWSSTGMGNAGYIGSVTYNDAGNIFFQVVAPSNRSSLQADITYPWEPPVAP